MATKNSPRKPKPGTMGAALQDPNSAISKFLAAHKAAGGNYNPYAKA
jgi:hypothetical protein